MLFITILAIIFLSLRFPRNSSISLLIFQRYGRDALDLFRKLEKIDFKIKKAKCNIKFLKKCVFYNVFPKFVQSKVSSITFTKTKLYH